MPVVIAICAAVTLAAAAGLCFLWVKAPSLYAPSGATAEAQANAVATTRTGIFAALAGLAAVASAAVNARALRINQRTLEETQRANHDAHAREMEAQVTERYTKAIEQLGDKERTAVRLGGIYALERLAIDSERDHRTVVEVLSAYVRDSSRSPQVAASSPKEPLATDIQAALTVLGRLPDRPLVSRGDLRGAILKNADLVEANFRGVQLSHADLTGANLGLARLTDAVLYKTVLTDALIIRASLERAELTKAILRDADLSGTDLIGASLEGIDATGAHGLPKGDS